jgi:L-aminopeptidase/D-esterase-like protein
MTSTDWFRVLQKEFRRRKTIIHVVATDERKMMNSLRRLARKAGYAWRFRRERGGVIVRKV